MIPLIAHKLAAIQDVCRRHGVRRLELFGSASDQADFDPNRSDVDIIISFPPGADLGAWMARYLDIKEDLQNVLGKSVDLVMDSAIRDPLFRQEAGRMRQVVYASQDTEAA